MLATKGWGIGHVVVGFDRQQDAFNQPPVQPAPFQKTLESRQVGVAAPQGLAGIFHPAERQPDPRRGDVGKRLDPHIGNHEVEMAGQIGDVFFSPVARLPDRHEVGDVLGNRPAEVIRVIFEPGPRQPRFAIGRPLLQTMQIHLRTIPVPKTGDLAVPMFPGAELDRVEVRLVDDAVTVGGDLVPTLLAVPALPYCIPLAVCAHHNHS